jgi:hypothetical protein
MFIEVTEKANHPETGEYQETPMLLNTRYIGVVYDGPEGAHIIVDNALLPDNVTHVIETKAEVKRRIEAALYGEENSYAVNQTPALSFPEQGV